MMLSSDFAVSVFLECDLMLPTLQLTPRYAATCSEAHGKKHLTENWTIGNLKKECVFLQVFVPFLSFSFLDCDSQKC